MLRALITGCALLTAPATQAATAVFALSNNYPPFMTEDGGILGAILVEANERLGGEHTIEIKSVPWARAVAMVERGQAHGLVGTYHRPEARPWIDPYSTPLLQEHVSVFCRKGVAGAGWRYPQDFTSVRFGYLIGSLAAGEEFNRMVEEGAIEVSEAATMESNVKKLAVGRVDCFAEGRLPILVELAGLDGAEEIEMVGDVTVEDSMVGFSGDWADSDENQAFIAAFNAVISDMHGDGTIESIVQSFVE